MSKIEINNVYKIFGPKPDSVLKMVQEGASKEDVLEKTGHTVGLDNVSLKIEEGETFVCMGLSGSGKSTLIRHLNRLIDPTSGEILVEGKDVTTLNKEQLIEFRRQKMSMQQRVGLARALATDTDIMLMDEAFSALDPLIRSDMQKQLIDLQSELKKTIVFITHDLDESLRLGDHIGILNAGKLVQVGTPVEIIMNPADEYVEAFVKDVNRTKVIKAKIIMKPVNQSDDIDKSNLIKVEEDQFIEEFLPQVVCSNSNCEVVDKQGNAKGYISNKELQESLSNS